MREVLSAFSVLDPVGWMDWVEPDEQLDGVAWGVETLLCGRVAVGVLVMGSVLTDQEFSVSPVGGAPRVADGVCILEVRYCKGEWGQLRRPVVVVPLFL